MAEKLFYELRECIIVDVIGPYIHQIVRGLLIRSLVFPECKTKSPLDHKAGGAVNSP